MLKKSVLLLAVSCVALGSACKARTFNDSGVNMAKGRTLTDSQLRDAGFVLPIWTYRCTSTRPQPPDLCTGSLGTSKMHVYTAHHCVEKLMGRHPATVLIPRKLTTDQHTAPTWEEVCRDNKPLPEFLRVTEWQNTDATMIGADMALLTLPEKLDRATVEIGDPAKLTPNTTIHAFGFGFSDCDQDPKGIGKQGSGIVRYGTFRILNVDVGMGKISLEPDQSGAVSCASDSGMGYLVRNDNHFEIIAVHKGKPDRLGKEMYGSLINARFICKVFVQANIPNPACH